MSDNERIRRLAAVLRKNGGDEMLNRFKCGGKKYDSGGKFFNSELREPESLVDVSGFMSVIPGAVSVPVNSEIRGLGLEGVPIDPSVNRFAYGPIYRERIGVRYSPVPYSEEGYDNLLANEEREALEDDILWRQRYVESNFNDRAVSPKGARGAWQIMPIAYQDYLTRGHGRPGNLDDPGYNRLVREHVLSVIPGDLGRYWSDNDSDDVKRAKLYTSYLWGAGNLRNYLKKAMGRGIDIGTLDWIDGLRKDIKDYVSFVALNRDVPGTRMTRDAFERAAAGHGYMGRGGRIHIKPENRGKFTALKKRTGHSASWFKAHGTPAQKKMAVFALNAKKWKHDDGGLLYKYGNDAVRAALLQLRSSHKYDGDTEVTGQMDRGTMPLYSGPQKENFGGVNYVTDYGPLVEIDDDSIYLGDLAASVITAEVPRPEKPLRFLPDSDMSLSIQADSNRPQTMLVDPGIVMIADRDSSDRAVLMREKISGKPIDVVSKDVVDSLGVDERTELEKELASQGWYNVSTDTILSGLKNRTDEVRDLQMKLRDLGYDLGKYGPNKDGVDGMIGKMTRAAIDRYVKEHPGQALQTAISYGKVDSKSTADALRRRAEYTRAHSVPLDGGGPRVQDSVLGEENIGTHYDNRFDNYTVGGFDASNVYNVPVIEYDKEESPLSFKTLPRTADTNECASAVTNYYLKNFGGDFIDKYNLRGHAWTMGRNIEKAGGERLFNLFDDFGAPRKNDKDVTINYVRRRAKEPEYKTMLREKIGVGDIVELLNPGSRKFERAYEESNGHNQNTHIGFVVEHNGDLYVLDNSGGTFHHTRLSDMIDGKERRGVLITGAVSVNDGDRRFNMQNGDRLYAADMSDLGITPNKEYDEEVRKESGKGIKYYNYNNEAAYREMASLKRNSGQLMSDYNLDSSEFNMLAALTHAASMMETRNGSLAPGRKFRAESGNIKVSEGIGPLMQEFGRYTLPNASEKISSGIRGREQRRQEERGEEVTTGSVLDKIPGVNKALKPVSRGLTNIKTDYHFTRSEQQSLPVEGNAAEQPESSAILGFSVLAKNYNHIKERLSGTELGRNQKLLYTLAALAHNQGLGNIDVNISRYLEGGDEEELLQYMHREKEYQDALKNKDNEKAEYYNGPRYSRLMMEFTKYNNYNIVI